GADLRELLLRQLGNAVTSFTGKPKTVQSRQQNNHTQYPMNTELTTAQELNDNLFVIELEERLEMVEAQEAISVSCCFDS
ncbi:hypothetical protein ACVWYF_004530, partial [Hymenobacter sp. UYAg731]